MTIHSAYVSKTLLMHIQPAGGAVGLHVYIWSEASSRMQTVKTFARLLRLCGQYFQTTIC